MRVALVVHDYERGKGHSRYVVELARRLRHEHEVHVFANVFEEAGGEGLHFHHVPAWRATALTSILTFLAAAGRRIGRAEGRSGAFDVVHSQGLTDFRGNVVTAHICNAAWYRSLVEEGLAVGWRQRLFRLLVHPLERRLFSPGRRSRSPNQVIAISDRVRRDLARGYGREQGVTVIHHGIDAEEFHPARRVDRRRKIRRQHGLGDEDFVFVFVGDLRKGGEAALAVVERVEGAKLLTVSRAVPPGLRRRAGTPALCGRTIFAPATGDIASYYAAADALLFPTPYDAFGMVISEAMAAGLPVITTRRAGAAELIESGVTGLLVDGPADLDGLVAHARRLATDRGHGRSLGAAARRRMETESWDRVAARTLRVYERAAARKEEE